MKPSSSPYEPIPWDLDADWIRALLDVEAALARAQARVGVLPPEYARQIDAACRMFRPDPGALAGESAEAGTPVVPLVRRLSAALDGPASAYVHQGATSQDIVDSAAMLLASRALPEIGSELGWAAERAAALSADHKETLMAGRTLMRHATPVTFGAMAAGWLSGLDGAWVRLDEIRRNRLAVQLGGATGTLAGMGKSGLAVLSAFAGELGLAEPALPWHTERGRVAELAAALAQTCGAAGKVAGDVVLLSQTEIGEVAEAQRPGRGMSSALPHKQNPVAATSVLAIAQEAPGLVATLYGTMGQELQRSAGRWQAEWAPLSRLLRVTKAATWWLRDCLAGLNVDPARMRANLDISGDLITAERVSAALGSNLGREKARELVSEACQSSVDSRRPLLDVLDEMRSIPLSRSELAELLDPSAYRTMAGAIVERALDAHRAVRSSHPVPKRVQETEGDP